MFLTFLAIRLDSDDLAGGQYVWQPDRLGGRVSNVHYRCSLTSDYSEKHIIRIIPGY